MSETPASRRTRCRSAYPGIELRVALQQRRKLDHPVIQLLLLLLDRLASSPHQSEQQQVHDARRRGHHEPATPLRGVRFAYQLIRRLIELGCAENLSQRLRVYRRVRFDQSRRPGAVDGPVLQL